MQGTRILLLDDDRETRWALATVLRREGAQVTEAANGEEGLRFLLRNRYDICISDVCMPGLGGFGLYAALRYGDGDDLAWAQSMPVLLISGMVPRRELAAALDAGVDDILEKPCEPEELKARVRAAIRRAKLVRGSQARTHGNLADFGMASLAQALHLGGRSARVCVQSGLAACVLDFQRGQIGHAQFEDPGLELRGEQAAIRALGLEDGVFEILPVPSSSPRTVFKDTPGLLLEAATRSDETGEIEKVAAAAVKAALESEAPTGDLADDDVLDMY